MSVTYYSIDEKTARLAHEMRSHRDYPENYMTGEYRRQVDLAAAIAEREKARKPEYAETIDGLLDRYARKLAEWMNTESRIGTMCPSILIAGGDGLSVRRKQRQNERMDAHMAKRADIDKLLERIKSIGTGGIQAGDENALVKLEAKLDDLKDAQETMKEINAYWRKNKTLDGCDLLPEEELEKIKANMARMSSYYGKETAPFAAYTLTNNNAEIHRIERRIKEIQAIKAAGDSETDVDGVDGLKVIHDTKSMRVQLIFDGKPDFKTRQILKQHGFRWAPSQNAWQRQLNSNGKSAAEAVIRALKEG